MVDYAAVVKRIENELFEMDQRERLLKLVEREGNVIFIEPERDTDSLNRLKNRILKENVYLKLKGIENV